MEILYEADRRRLAKLLDEREQQKQVIENQIEKCDKKVFRKAAARSRKRYNLTQAAQILGVHRQTLYYWMKNGWVKPKRDYRGYPVFTVLDIESVIKWKNTIKSSATSKGTKSTQHYDEQRVNEILSSYTFIGSYSFRHLGEKS